MRLRLAVVALALLPLAGCVPAGEDAAVAPVAPAVVQPTTVEAPARPATEAATTEPPVPVVRATLPPARPERPAPRRFVAAPARIDLPVRAAGVDDAGLMELPATVQEVAWYAYSARPGDRSGTTVLAAHVDTRAEGLGPFARLRELDEGAELTVVDGDGRDLGYVVTDVTTVDKAEVPIERVFRRDGPPALVVITCGGSFDRGDGYSDNVIVTARPR